MLVVFIICTKEVNISKRGRKEEQGEEERKEFIPLLERLSSKLLRPSRLAHMATISMG